MRFSNWVRSLLRPPAQKRSPIRTRSARLGVLQLEDRITPDSRDVAGLRFLSQGTFAGSSSNATISTDVQVGLVPVAGGTFTPLLNLPGGVTVSTSPASATIKTSMTVRGLTFTGNSLAFGFPQPGRFTITGQASFTAGGVTIGASFGSPLGTNPGLVIQNGQITSVDTAITSQFSFGGLSFNNMDLRLKLDTASGTTRYAVSGAASAAFTGTNGNSVNLGVRFGQSAQKPGLVVQNGQLTALDVGVSGGFNVGGLSFQATDVTFSYNRTLDRFGMSGAVAVSTPPVAGGRRVLDNLGVQLGSFGSPGLVVKSNRLESLDFAVNGALNLASLSVSAQNLRVQFNRATSVLQFTGGLTVSLASRINASVNLPNGGLTINTQTGEVQLNGLRLGVTDTTIGPVSVKNAFVLFTRNANGTFNLSGGATVDLPAGLTVEGLFEIQNSRLKRIKLSLSKNPGVPLGSSGVFVSGVSADLDNLDTPNQLKLAGTVTFTAGPSYRIGGVDVALLKGTVGVGLDLVANTVRFDGRLSMFGDAFELGRGSLVIFFNPATKSVTRVQVRAEVNLYAGFVRGNLDFDLSSSGDFFVFAKVALRIPDIKTPELKAGALVIVPSFNLGGQELASADITLSFRKADPQNSFIAFSARLIEVFQADVLVTFGGKVRLNGKVFGIPLPETNFTVKPLFTDTTPPPLPPAAPPGYTPTVRVLSAERLPNTGTNDLRITYQATTIDRASAVVNLGFSTASTPNLFRIPLGNLAEAPGATFDPATGVGTVTIQLPDIFIAPGRPFFVTAQIQDRFASKRGDQFGPLQPTLGAPGLVTPAAIVDGVPAVGQPAAVFLPGRPIRTFEPTSATFFPNTTYAVTLQADASLILRVPAGQLPAGVNPVQPRDSDLTLVGAPELVNTALARLTVARARDASFVAIKVIVARAENLATSSDGTIVVRPAPAVAVTPPPTTGTTAVDGGGAVFPFATENRDLLTVAPGARIQSIRVAIGSGTGPGARADAPGDNLTAFVPPGVPLDVFFDTTPGFAPTLIIVGDDTETLQELQNAVDGIEFRVTTPGVVSLRLTITASPGSQKTTIDRRSRSASSSRAPRSPAPRSRSAPTTSPARTC